MGSDESSEMTTPDLAPESAEETSTKPLAPTSAPTSRRRFLTAAALGTAAAAWINRGSGGTFRIGPASVSADVLTNVNCTANDVRIVGPGIILNEPCNCSGTFNANVQFHIINNTGTTRYCVTVHLCDGVDASGNVVVPARDIIVGDIPANFDGLKTVQISNYPCGSGNVCFGAAGSGPDGGFAKGETCPTGKCCTVISWNVRPNDPCPVPHSDIIKSKCRAQQVCIQGRGATLTCESNCTPECGGAVTLKLCGFGGTTPYTFSLSDGTNTYQPTSTSGNCALFNVTVTTTTTFTGTVTDSSSPPCAQASNSITLNVTPVADPILDRQGPDCSGSVTITVTNCDANLTYVFREGNTVIPSNGCSCTNTYAPGQHTVTVTASNTAGTCTAQASTTFTVNQPVSVVLGAPQSGCNGVVTLSVAASGGTGSYTFVASAGTLSGSGNTRTVTLQPQLDGQCRSVTCTVTDSAGCSGTSNTVSFSQCVTTTVCP